MKKTPTQKSKVFLNILGKIPSLLALLLAIIPNLNAFAQSPYCAISHTTTCSTYGMWIDGVTITSNGANVYTKAGDACNNTNTINYALITSSSAFTLNGGATYNLSLNTNGTNPTNVGIWIDLNGDYDFDDANEFIANFAVGSSGNKTFTMPCNLTSGTTRMRLRMGFSGSITWNTSNACTSTPYGETEDYTISVATSSGLRVTSLLQLQLT